LFWALTLREIGHIMDGAARRIERDKLFADSIAWNTAQLTRFSYHAPKDIPTFERFRGGRVRQSRSAAPHSWQDIKNRVRIFNGSIGGRVERK
jgi:hypothetical protein